MAIQHSAITDAALHPPKGASTATINETIHSNGAGGVTWEKVSPVHLEGITTSGTKGQRLVSDGIGGWILSGPSHGSISFVNIGAPYVLAATTSFSKAAPTTVPSGDGVNFTESVDGRLTFTGTHTIHAGIYCYLSVDHVAGVNRDVSIAIAKNGVVVASTEQVSTCTSALKQMISTQADLALATNDYVEVFLKISAAGNINVYCYNAQVDFVGIKA